MPRVILYNLNMKYMIEEFVENALKPSEKYFKNMDLTTLKTIALSSFRKMSDSATEKIIFDITNFDKIADEWNKEFAIFLLYFVINNSNLLEYILYNGQKYTIDNYHLIFSLKKSISTKKDLLNMFEIEEKNYYYRGESAVYKNPLSTTLSRTSISKKEYEIMKQTYLINAKLFQKKGIVKTDQIIAHAQHHGMPTEMVDLTRKLGIALFFGIDKSISDQNFTIFQIPKNIAPSDKEEEYTGGEGEFRFFTPQFIDKRIEAQQGLFMQPSQDTEILKSLQVIRNWANGEEGITIYEINGSLKPTIKKYLKHMNIDPYTIYQDFDSLARSIKERWK